MARLVLRLHKDIQMIQTSFQKPMQAQKVAPHSARTNRSTLQKMQRTTHGGPHPERRILQMRWTPPRVARIQIF